MKKGRENTQNSPTKTHRLLIKIEGDKPPPIIKTNLTTNTVWAESGSRAALRRRTWGCW